MFLENINSYQVFLFFQKNTGSLVQPLSRVQISTMKIFDNLMVAGGFNGELICKVTVTFISNMPLNLQVKLTKHHFLSI